MAPHYHLYVGVDIAAKTYMATWTRDPATAPKAVSFQLDEKEQAQLERFLVHSPVLQQAITLREELTVIFDTARGRADGLRRLRFWRQSVTKSEFTCFNRFLKLLDNWLDLIANYFIDHQTSASVEGLNTTLKVLKRRCYGLRNIGRLFQRLTRDVEGFRRFSPWYSFSSQISGSSEEVPKSQNFCRCMAG